MPDIKINIGATYDDKAAKEAIKDQEKLEQATEKAASIPPAPAPAPAPATPARSRPVAAPVFPENMSSRIVDAAQPLPRSAGAVAYEANRVRPQNVPGKISQTATAAQGVAPIAETIAPARAAETPAAVAASAATAAKDTAKRHEAEKGITSEHRKQEVITKAREAGATRLLKQAAGAASSGFGSASGMSMMGISGMLSNPLAIAALLGGSVAGKLGSDALARIDSTAHQQGRIVAGANRRQQIASGTYGDSQTDRTEAASAAANENKAALDNLIADRLSDRDKGFGDMVMRDVNSAKNALGFGGIVPDLETSGNRAGREREDEIARREKERPLLEKQAYDEAMKGAPGMELQRRREVLESHMKEARAIEHKALWEREYQSAIKQFRGSPEGEAAARESADMAVKIKVRQEDMKFGGLINARSGAGDIARAAGLALGEYGGRSDPSRAIQELTQVTKANHAQAQAAGAGTTNMRPALRPGT